MERVEGYTDKAEDRTNSFHNVANVISKRFEFKQPILVGHHSERKARKEQERMNSNMKNAVQERDKIQHYNWKLRVLLHTLTRKYSDLVNIFVKSIGGLLDGEVQAVA
ncbi:MAG: DUF3560 domain-containing protein [Halopseudomonas aestusnigri]